MNARILVAVVAIGLSLFHIYTGVFGSLEAYMQRIIHLALGLSLLYLTILIPQNNNGAVDSTTTPRSILGYIYNRYVPVLLLIILVLSQIYLILNYDYLMGGRFPYMTPLSTSETLIGLLIVLIVIDATKRTMGWGMTILAILFFLYPMMGPYLPGIFGHDGKSLSMFIDNLVYTTDGIYGIPLGISATFLILFVIFAALLEEVGFGRFLLKFASGVSGKRRGGPAKIAVLTSALTGMVSGSAVANVVSTGSFSIPLMKRIGYSREYAGAVEAAASTGAQFLPPIMGAQAFIMAQFTGIPYFQIALYSLIPAVLYFVGVWINLDVEARRLNLRGLDEKEIGDWKSVTKSHLHLLIPFILLVYLLSIGRTPMFAIIYSMFALVLVSLFTKHTRLTRTKLVNALQGAANMSLTVIAASAVSGIIIGAVTLTGLGDRFTSFMIDMSGGSLFLALVMAAIASLILGMGLPTIPAYIVQISILVPSLIEMGLNPVVAHLFAIYFSCISMITPPVAIAAFAASAISGGNAFKTGLTATKVGSIAFVVPFLFAYEPALLLIDTNIFAIIWSVIKAIIVIFALAFALQGYYFNPIKRLYRLLSLVAVILIVAPVSVLIDSIGLLIIIFIYIDQYRNKTKFQNLEIQPDQYKTYQN
ncbi:TRAP transporter permease [Bacillus sp. Marseille-P3661]|uniref:TRAP transporter permease n=1 Tax=Bacillus sp. Marseille-P3661 TaxID=1936234 RepID=UPI000C847109|nr:TRAP transporter fused permease subunit [Bacillus sp. Marseille-P3661]